MLGPTKKPVSAKLLSARLKLMDNPPDGVYSSCIGQRYYYEATSLCDGGDGLFCDETWRIETFEDGRLVDNITEDITVFIQCR